jgi:hypothetical protein
LVICPDEKTAASYTIPVPTALEDCLYRPKALLPSRIPPVTDPRKAAADPALAVLSVAYEYANILSSEQVRDLLEALVTRTQAPRYSAFAKRHFAEGESSGEVRGERNTIRMVLKARSLTLTEDQNKKIDDCDDLGQLKKWAEAAVTAEDAGDIFK